MTGIQNVKGICDAILHSGKSSEDAEIIGDVFVGMLGSWSVEDKQIHANIMTVLHGPPRQPGLGKLLAAEIIRVTILAYPHRFNQMVEMAEDELKKSDLPPYQVARLRFALVMGSLDAFADIALNQDETAAKFLKSSYCVLARVLLGDHLGKKLSKSNDLEKGHLSNVVSRFAKAIDGPEFCRHLADGPIAWIVGPTKGEDATAQSMLIADLCYKLFGCLPVPDRIVMLSQRH